MKAFCPFCGTEVDPASAAPGGLPHTMLCPACGQEQDHPQAPATPATSGDPAPAARPAEPADSQAAEPPASSPQTSPSPPPLPPPLPAGPAGPAMDDPLDWAWQEGPPTKGLPSQGPAWEGEAGLLTRLWRTTWQVLGHPGRTLAPPPAQPGLSWPLSYGLVLGTFSTAVTLLWGLLLGSSSLSSKAALWMLFLAPVISLGEMFFTTAVVHVMLFILGGNKNGFSATFRVNAYGEAAGLLAIVPFVGTAAVLIWHVVIMTAGLATAHGIGKGRALAAIILPPVLVMMLVMLVVLAVGFTALLALLGELGKSGGGWGM
ncbi:MAG: YIP1 family protein [Pseudomonadota bacterium]